MSYSKESEKYDAQREALQYDTQKKVEFTPIDQSIFKKTKAEKDSVKVLKKLIKAQ